MNGRLLAWFVLATATTTAAAEETTFRFSKPITTPQLQREELVSVALDPEVFAATRDGFPDLRIVDSAGSNISFLVQRAATTKPQVVRDTWTARELEARPLDDGSLEITIQLDQDAPEPNGLRLVSPLRNFEQRLRLFTSTDGRQWEPWGDETVVFDYSRFLDVRSDDMSFPRTSRRHFRLVVDDVTADQQSELLDLTLRLRGDEPAERVERIQVDRRPFRINRIEFWKETRKDRVTGDRKRDYPLPSFRVESNAEKQQTLLLVDSRREPLTSLKLVTDDRNFSRQAVVEVEEEHDGNPRWRKIGEETLARLDFRELKREQLTIPFPESRKDRYRVVINNRDSKPLEVTGVAAEGNVYQGVFLAAPEEHYRLVYGSEEAEGPNYDTSAIRTLLAEGFQTTDGELGIAEEIAGPTPTTTFTWGRLLGDVRVLAFAIVLLILVLGWALYSAGRRVEMLSREERGEE